MTLMILEITDPTHRITESAKRTGSETGEVRMFALVVRFELADEYAAQGFDALLAEALPYISAEPGTLLYLAHTVEDAPLSRIFYELYENRDAHVKHESYDHTSRFLAEKDQYLTGFRVEFLDEPTGKGLPQLS
jgi:quinol monooxygenase YgiN